ncbi:helix-turn-helix domain-containing protein [Pseudomonas aeruginosa]|nr:helix-turn-helix domain-containing protein [Pseudomonas aeruginosa]
MERRHEQNRNTPRQQRPLGVDQIPAPRQGFVPGRGGPLLDVSSPAVKNAKLNPYPRVERAIAAVLDLSPLVLWPERWLDDENPKRQRPNRSETLKAYDSVICRSGKNNRYADQAQRKADAGA